MAPETVTGLVLSSGNIGETDRRIVLLTREKGKISAFARGAVKPKNPLVTATQVFTFGEFFVYTGRDSYTVTGAEVKNHFQGLIKELDKYYYASYLCEIADYYTRENLNAKNELLLLYQALRALEKNIIKNELVRYIYEWRMFFIGGEYPEVTKCILCGDSENLTHFSSKRHGCLCRNCSGSVGDSVTISVGMLYTLRYIMSSGLQTLFAFTVKEDIMAEFKNLTKIYISADRNVKFNSEMFIDGEFGM